MAQNSKPTVQVPSDSESIISMVLGAMVVVVIGALLFSYVRDWKKDTTPEETAPTEQQANQEPLIIEELPVEVKTETDATGKVVPTNLPAKYTVKAGDSTWKIAEAFYGSGFNYVDIEQANNLQPEQELTAGQELTIPKVAVRTSKDSAPANRQYTEVQGVETSEIGPEKGDNTAAEAALQE